jgi:amidase
LFEDAIERAKQLDDYYSKHGRLLGPLHGVPMTLKDQFDVEGYDSTLGYVGRAFKAASQDCVLVSMLRRMGAIIIAKSNLPQSIMVCSPGEVWFIVIHVH